MKLLEALSLFEETQQPSWLGWRSLAARIEGREPEDPAFVERVTGRTDRKPAKKVFAICGRGAGKSRFGALVACAFAMRTYKRVAGESIYVGIFAPDRRQATVSFGYVKGLLTSNLMTASLVVGETASSLTLSTGVKLEVLTANFRTVRSRAYALAIVEEAAFLPADNSANPDTEILRALRPALGRVKGSMLMVLSSPYARRGELYKAHREHFGKAGSDTLVVEASTLDLNPTFDRSEIEAAYTDDPIAAASEYGALELDAQPRITFRSDVETFISRESLDAVVAPGRLELPRLASVPYVAFVDPSGGSSDSFTLGIAHAERRGDQAVAILDLVREVRPPFSPEQVVTEYASLLKAYGISTVAGDRYSGEFVRELFRKASVTYLPSERDRSTIYLELLAAINSRRVELLENARLLTQLANLERRTGRSGKDTVDHPPGSHDDVANAVAGALVLATMAVPSLDLSNVDAWSFGVPKSDRQPWHADNSGIVTDAFDSAIRASIKRNQPRNPVTDFDAGFGVPKR